LTNEAFSQIAQNHFTGSKIKALQPKPNTRRISIEEMRQKYLEKMEVYEQQTFKSEPKSMLQFFIEQTFQQDLEHSRKKLTNGKKVNGPETEPLVCKKLWYSSIVDKLDSQTDIFCYDQQYFRESREIYKERMQDIFQWVCQNVLLDAFELCYLFRVLDHDAFDILNVRSATNMGIKLEYLILYVAIHLRIHLNNYQQK
jgi:hypothetical protein